MLFTPLPFREETQRRVKKRKHRGDLSVSKRSRDDSENLGNPPGHYNVNVPNDSLPGKKSKTLSGGDQFLKIRKTPVKKPLSPQLAPQALDLPCSGSSSLFRLDDRLSLAPKLSRHPKRTSNKPLVTSSGLPGKSLPGDKERKDVDSNREAPFWLIEEDYQLLMAVRLFLTVATGGINWHLVAGYVNSSTCLTGRYRSRNQCRDRYAFT